MKTIYFNLRSNYGIETVDELCSSDFDTGKEFRAEVRRLVSEYHLAGIAVYTSQRATKEWRSK